MAAILPLQRAIGARLKGSAGVTALVGNRIYDGAAPQGAVRPYVVVDQQTETRAGVFGRQASANSTMINVFSSYPGILEVANVLDAIDAALTAPLTVTGYGTAGLKRLTGDVFAEDDGTRHLAARYRAFAIST